MLLQSYLLGIPPLLSTPSLLVTRYYVTGQLNDDHIDRPSIQSLARRWHYIKPLDIPESALYKKRSPNLRKYYLRLSIESLRH